MNRSRSKRRQSPAGSAPHRFIRVEVSDQQVSLPVKAAAVRSAVRHVLVAENVRRGSVSVALVDDAIMRAVHREFFRLDAPTDVITFQLNEPGQPLDGEIVVSVETAVRMAPRHGLTPLHETLLYVVHGALHLCGYDDRRRSDARKMRKRQNELLGGL